MLQELDTNYQAELRITKLGLGNLMTQLKTANEAVRTLMAQRNDERTYQQKAALATARKQADEAYHDFVTMLNAAALMDDEYTYEELINRINELIDYNRKYVVPKKGSKSEDEDGGDSEDGGSSEDGGQQDGVSSDFTPVTPEPTPSGGSGGGDE